MNVKFKVSGRSFTCQHTPQLPLHATGWRHTPSVEKVRVIFDDLSLVKSSGSFCHVSVHPCHAMSTFHFLRSPPFLLRSSSLICSGSREPQKSFSLALLQGSQANPCDGRNHELLGFSVGRRHRGIQLCSKTRTEEQLEGSLRLREFNHIVVTGFQDSLGHPQNIGWG